MIGLLTKKWSKLIHKTNTTLKVGLVWSGNPKHKKDRARSCSLDAFAPLAHTDITFFSLQKGQAAEEAQNPPKELDFINLTDGINDFTDTAAMVENLDLVISMDTSIAHLAGAMGKPVWTLIPFSPDWRWLLNRNDSPWYSTMRLFR